VSHNVLFIIVQLPRCSWEVEVVDFSSNSIHTYVREQNHKSTNTRLNSEEFQLFFERMQARLIFSFEILTTYLCNWMTISPVESSIVGEIYKTDSWSTVYRSVKIATAFMQLLVDERQWTSIKSWNGGRVLARAVTSRIWDLRFGARRSKRNFILVLSVNVSTCRYRICEDWCGFYSRFVVRFGFYLIPLVYPSVAKSF
jgi:hypothetical protein